MSSDKRRRLGSVSTKIGIMKLNPYSRFPYEEKTKDFYSPKIRMRNPLSPKPALEFYASQDIYTILPRMRRDDPEEKKSPAKPVERYSPDSEDEPQSEPKDYKSKAREMLLEQVNYLSAEFQYTFDLAPSSSFFKFLCARPGLKVTIPKLKLWVADTVVYNDTDRPFWIYTNLSGEVCRYEGFHELEVMSKLPKTAAASDATVLLKKPLYDHKRKRGAGNTTVLVQNDQLKDKVRMLQRGDGEKAVLQRYIRSHGLNRFICRSVYQKDRMPYGWLITATDPAATITDSTSNIVRITSGNFLISTSALVLKLVKYLETYLKVTFELLACDFIRDDGDVWWLINIKAFKTTSSDSPALHFFIQKGVIDDQKDQIASGGGLKEYTRQKRCEFCHVGFEMLSHELTLKMIFEMEEHLRKRGKIVSWLEYKEYRHIDEATLYQNYSVCDYCFKLYTETQILKQIEADLAATFGIPKKSDEAPVQELELEPNIPLRVIKDDPTSHSNFSSLSKFRFLVIFNEIQNVNFGEKSNYSLEYEFLGKIHKVKLPNNEQNLVLLCKMRMFYLFSNGRGKFNLFLRRQSHLLVRLMEDGVEISKVRLSLIDFKSPFVIAKYYCEHFGDRNGPVLAAHIGIVGEPAEKISDLALRAFHEVYLPPEDYITCDPLPEEWLNVLPSVSSMPSSISLKNLPHPRSVTAKGDFPPTPSHLRKRKSARFPRSHSSNTLFQQRFGEINALLQQPSQTQVPLIDPLSPITTPKSEYPNYEDFTVSLNIISVNNIERADEEEVWRLQFTAFRNSKVMEKALESGLNSCWLSFNTEVKFAFRALESDLTAFIQSSVVEFKVCKANSKVLGMAKLDLIELPKEKYIETELPLAMENSSHASLTVTASLAKVTQGEGKVTRQIAKGVYEVKLTGTYS